MFFHDCKGEIKYRTVLVLRAEFIYRNESEDILETHVFAQFG